MSSNEEQIRALYADGEREESRAAQSRSAGMEFAYTMKTMEKHIQKTDRVLEVGCATRYYALRLAPLCREHAAGNPAAGPKMTGCGKTSGRPG